MNLQRGVTMRSTTIFAVFGLALASSGCTYTATPDPTLSSRDTEYLATIGTPDVSVGYERRKVDDPTGEPQGTIVVDPVKNYLYFVLPDHQAIRYGVSTGREAYGWKGTAYVRVKKEWPTWLPPADMVDRLPHLRPVADMGGLPGGPENPLGSRALYLFDTKGHDTLYRIHGTNEPYSIGQGVSSGCIRMTNIDAIDLFNRAPVGTKVIVR